MWRGSAGWRVTAGGAWCAAAAAAVRCAHMVTVGGSGTLRFDSSLVLTSANAVGLAEAEDASMKCAAASIGAV